MGKINKYCIECGKLALPKYSRCERCYKKRINARGKKRYKTEKVFRQERQKQARDAYTKKHKEKPGFFAKKQREFRKNEPEKYCMIMTRSYMRRLNRKQKEDLIWEILKDM